MSRVFISYAREDVDWALRLYDDLRRAGFAPWLDRNDLLGGQNWKRAIGEAIRASSFFIALISERSVSKRGYVQSEIYDALEVYRQVPPGQIYFVPVRLDPTEPPHTELKDLHWIDLFPSYEDGLRRLLESLRAHDREAAAPRAAPEETRSKPAPAPAPEASTFVQPRSESSFFRFPATPPTFGSSPLGHVVERDDSDGCTYDENGVCDNQKHWGANE